MVRYEFESLGEMAAYIRSVAKTGYRDRGGAYGETERRSLTRQAIAMENIAYMIEHSIIKPPAPLGMVDPSLIDFQNPKTQAELLKVASAAYNGGLQGFYQTNNFIAAIKAVRNATGLNLKEAKDWCDAHRHKFK